MFDVKEKQEDTYAQGLKVYSDVMFSFAQRCLSDDVTFDVDANENVTCEQGFIIVGVVSR